MENIDILRSQFQTKGMVPSINDDVTLLWGRKIVHNTMNGYGIIGTIRLDGADIQWLNLGLTKTYMFPPEVTIFWQANGMSQLNHNDSNFFTETSTVLGNVIENFKRVTSYVKDDLIGFRANLQGFGGNPNYHYIDVFFKIHGV